MTANKDHPNWGGKRPGAGRKREGTELLHQYQVRLPPSLMAFYEEHGGKKLIRRILTEYKAACDQARLQAPLSDIALKLGCIPLDTETRTEIPSAKFQTRCGMPDPAIDTTPEPFDAGAYFVDHADATFVVTAVGTSMINAGIYDGDKLFIDSAIEPRSGHIVLAYLDGGLTVKRLRFENNRPILCPENPEFPIIRPECLDDFRIMGVVVSVGRRYQH